METPFLAILLVALAHLGSSGALASPGATRSSGGPTWSTLELEDGTTLDYALVLPPDHDPARPAPLLLALPPGSQDAGLVERGLELYFTEPARRRGWVVVSPAAPGGAPFGPGCEARLEALLDHVAGEFAVEAGGAHLAGVSNGGRTAFHVAGLRPGRFASLTVAPGMPADGADGARLADLAHLPIRLHVGEQDAGWLEGARAVTARLEELGAPDVELSVHAGQGHVLDPALGEAIFDALDDLRARRDARERERARVEAVLDDLHAAAACADGPRYFGHFAPGAVFLGTDASERWTLAEFRAWAAPHFEGESAWTFEPFERHVSVEGPCAWFDEKLRNAKYGQTRGSGLLVRRGERWLVAHYVLSFAVPNDAAQEVVEAVRRHELPR